MTSKLHSLANTNISLHTIPFAILIALAPRMWARYVYQSSLNKDMDIAHPREWSKALAMDSELDNKTQGQLIRAEAAMSNGLENIGLYAAAVTAGNAAGLSTKALNGLSLGYLASRVVYNVVYIWAGVEERAKWRSMSYMLSAGLCCTLFIKAGEKFKNLAS